MVSKVVDQLKQYGETRRGWLGVKIQDVTPDVAEAMGLTDAKGALVTDVPDGPAKEAGMLAGDVVTTFNGTTITDVRSLTRTVADSPVGAAVPVLVMRDGKEVELKVTLGRREDAEASEVQPAAAEPGTPQEKQLMGLTLQALTADNAQELGLPAGSEGLVVTAVDESSDAFDKGLRAGDVITEAGQQAVTSLKDLEDRVTEAQDGGRKSILLLVRHEGNPRFVALPLDK